MPFTDSIKMVDVVIADKELITATPSDVASGKQFIGSTQHVESGILPINTTVSDLTLSAGESHNVANGINPVSYNVKAKDLASQTAGTANSNEIIKNKIAWVNGVKVTGTMTNNGSVSQTLDAGAVYTIPVGFHDGTGHINAKPLDVQTSATAEVGNILAGKTAWVNGNKISGTMPNNSTVTPTLQCGETYTVPLGYHNGNDIITAASLSSQTQGNATAREIAAGYSAWVNGVKINGTMPSNPAEEIVLPINGSYNIPNGYHTGSGKVTQSIPTKAGQIVGPSKDTQILELTGYCMTGDITITGVDALNYNRPNSSPKDSHGTTISNYQLTVSNNTAIIDIYVDNWHDNNTCNVYKATFNNLKDSDGNNVNLTTIIFFDYANQSSTSYTFGKVTITCSFDDGDNAQKITISGINSGYLTLIENLGLRVYGTANS